MQKAQQKYTLHPNTWYSSKNIKIQDKNKLKIFFLIICLTGISLGSLTIDSFFDYFVTNGQRLLTTYHS